MEVEAEDAGLFSDSGEWRARSRTVPRMTRRRPILAVAVCGMLSAVTFGCSTTKIIDEAELRRFIETDLAAQLDEEISDVKCPRLREPSTGDRFECTGVVDGSTVRFSGEVTDAADGSVWIENADAILFTALVEDAIVDAYRSQLGVEASADCGSTRLRVEAPGSSFRCSIDDGSTVRVDVLDAEGNVDFETE